jgi:hypothetical protein
MTSCPCPSQDGQKIPINRATPIDFHETKLQTLARCLARCRATASLHAPNQHRPSHQQGLQHSFYFITPLTDPGNLLPTSPKFEAEPSSSHTSFRSLPPPENRPGELTVLHRPCRRKLRRGCRPIASTKKLQRTSSMPPPQAGVLPPPSAEANLDRPSKIQCI